MNFTKYARGLNPQRLAGMPSSFVQKMRDTAGSAAEAASTAWSDARDMAQAYESVFATRKGQATQAAVINRSKAVTVGIVLILFAVIVIGRFGPEAFDAVNNTETDDGTLLTDVPGGDLFQNTGFLLILLMFLVVLVLWALDLI